MGTVMKTGDRVVLLTDGGFGVEGFKAGMLGTVVLVDDEYPQGWVDVSVDKTHMPVRTFCVSSGPEVKALPKVGEYITWGAEYSAHMVTSIDDEHIHIGGSGSRVKDGSTACDTPWVVGISRNWRIIERPSSDLFEDDTILSAASGPTESPPVDPSQEQKADGGKSNPLLLEVDLVSALSAVNAVMDYGVAKYGSRKGWASVDTERYNAAARRHKRSRDEGEECDPESGLLHLAHEATNILFQLQSYMEDHPGYDFTTFNAPPQDHRKTTSG